MKKLYPGKTYVQSAGVHSDLEVDGFAVAVCEELGIELHRHQSQRQALELTRYYHLDVEYWPIMDPTGIGETREAKLDAYRQARDQIIQRMTARFGPSHT